jgi:hypothetical protein
VPISYRFRDGGRSFVKLGRYLRQVVPATLRLLAEPVPTPSPRESVMGVR